MAHVIIGLAGSLRRGSLNRKLLVASAPLVPPGFTLVIEGLDGIPLYDGDLEATAGIPPAVAALKEKIAAAPALLIASPEYNNSIPGPLKNAIDWLSRPAKDVPRVFGGKATGVIGASPGRYGALSAQNAWLTVLRALGVVPYFGGRVTVAAAHTVFAEDGTFADVATRDRVKSYLDGFTAFIGRYST
jgi:NAD(P)H-dependent FMN reductase